MPHNEMIPQDVNTHNFLYGQSVWHAMWGAGGRGRGGSRQGMSLNVKEKFTPDIKHCSDLGQDKSENCRLCNNSLNESSTCLHRQFDFVLLQM